MLNAKPSVEDAIPRPPVSSRSCATCRSRSTPGDSACVMGPSGSGKSTLLYILGGLEPPTSGTVQLDGTDPYTLSADALAAFRNRDVGFVLQDHCLLPQCTVLENVLVPTLVGEADAAAPERARALLRSGRPRRAPAITARRTVGRRETARRDRPRAHPQSAADALRRADRQSRCGNRRHRRRSADRAACEAEGDHDPGHAQRGARRALFAALDNEPRRVARS